MGIYNSQWLSWLAIHYDCPGGQPLNRQGNIIRVAFGPDGLFCTSDSSFAWHGQRVAQDTNGSNIPFEESIGQTGYGICCQGSRSTSVTRAGREVEATFDLLWVGDLQHKPTGPNDDALQEDVWTGTLVPAEW